MLPLILNSIGIMVCTVPLQIVIFCALKRIQINARKPNILRAIKDLFYRNYFNFSGGTELSAEHSSGRMKTPFSAYPQKFCTSGKFAQRLFQHDYGARFCTSNFIITSDLGFLISTNHFVKLTLWLDIK